MVAAKNRERKVCFLNFFIFYFFLWVWDEKGKKKKRKKERTNEQTKNVFGKESRCKRWAGVTLL